MKMAKVLMIYVQRIESMNRWLGKIVSFLVYSMIFIYVFEAVRRYVFNIATIWAFELSQFILGSYFLLGGAYVLQCNEHVRMDALYNRWSVKQRAIIDLATFSLVVIYLTVFIWGGILDVGFALRYDQRIASLWAPPVAPIKIIVTVGAAVLLLQAVALFIRDVSIVKGKPMK